MTARRSTGSRETIVAAALACTTQEGWDATSLQAVRERAGVSNGTLFHHFPTRRHLEIAVTAAGLSDHQDALLDVLRAARSARDGVAGVVRRHLAWVQENQEIARLLLSTSIPAMRAELPAATLAANREFFGAVAEWLRGHGWPGVPDLAVLTALWLGPAQDYARGWLAAPSQPLDAVADALADGAWQALRPLLGKEPR